MEDFNKARVMEVSDKIQTFLDKLSKEEGIQMSMAGGKFTADSFTLKIQGKLIDEETGEIAISDASNSAADRAARDAGISFVAPHFIGSVWMFRKSGLVCVTDYSRKNRKYPFICKVYADDRSVKASSASFTSEIAPPTREEFYKWFTLDPDDDAISRKDEAICDIVNDYISCRFNGNPSLEKLYDACGDYFDKVVGSPTTDKEISNKAHNYLIKQGNVIAAEAYIRKQLK